jgi:hypothetical protein
LEREEAEKVEKRRWGEINPKGKGLKKKRDQKFERNC